MDGGVVVSGGTRIVVVLGFAALSDITPARLSSRLSTPSETSIQIVDRPKLLRTDQNSSSTSSSSVVLFSISFRQQLPGVSSHPLLCSSANAKRFTDPFLCSWSASSCHQKDSFRVYCYGSVIASVVGRFSRTNTQPQTTLNYLFCTRFGACCPLKSKECANSQLMFSGIYLSTRNPTAPLNHPRPPSTDFDCQKLLLATTT